MSKTTTNNKKKLNLKDRLNDDTLDLSLCDLETVPVKEILELSNKVKKLNLSYNRLTSLPEDFIKLQNVKELDLSKNHLKSLPKNFGALSNLRNLDLLGNELTGLPSSFSELKSLQWLDLKNNPLTNDLKKLAGDCLDEAQCKKCAINVIKYIKVQAADEERQRQIELKKKREEQLLKEAEEKEKAKQLKLQKKQEREQRKLINDQRRAEREMIESIANRETNENRANDNSNNSNNRLKKQNNSNLLKDCFKVLFGSVLSVFFTIVFIVGCLILIANYCDANKNEFRAKYGFLAKPLSFLDNSVCPSIERLNKNLPIEKIDAFFQSLEIFDLFSSLLNLF